MCERQVLVRSHGTTCTPELEWQLQALCMHVLHSCALATVGVAVAKISPTGVGLLGHVQTWARSGPVPGLAASETETLLLASTILVIIEPCEPWELLLSFRVHHLLGHERWCVRE